MYIVYVLQSQLNKQLYVGFTENLEQRIATHNRGEVRSTKAYRPWNCIFHECYTNKADAIRREQYLKTTAGKRALKLMLRETFALKEGI